jgi:ABC-type dipeptide/oligopeptide/nickel transport system permease component
MIPRGTAATKAIRIASKASSMVTGKVTTADIDKLREKMGLNRPIHIQYGAWVWDLMKGDMGTSLWYKNPVFVSGKEHHGRVPRHDPEQGEHHDCGQE